MNSSIQFTISRIIVHSLSAMLYVIGFSSQATGSSETLSNFSRVTSDSPPTTIKRQVPFNFVLSYTHVKNSQLIGGERTVFRCSTDCHEPGEVHKYISCQSMCLINPSMSKKLEGISVSLLQKKKLISSMQSEKLCIRPVSIHRSGTLILLSIYIHSPA